MSVAEIFGDPVLRKWVPDHGGFKPMSVGVAPPRVRLTSADAVARSLRPKRRVWLLIASLLSMVVCAGAFALVYVRADTRLQVLAVARPVVAGQTIVVADLR